MRIKRLTEEAYDKYRTTTGEMLNTAKVKFRVGVYSCLSDLAYQFEKDGLVATKEEWEFALDDFIRKFFK